MDPRNPDINVHSKIHGFELLRMDQVPALNIVFYEFRHIQTGAHFIHLSSEDDNNVFSVVFRTIPKDSTGVAHILEHAILEGSHKYPVKIFKHLHGRSLNTFLNAMTGADYTGYPFASRNPKDYFNLLDIYLDAVFFPLLKREVFLQEGWRFEFASPKNPDTPLMYKGVVYNEMKGAMSSPLRIFHEVSKQAMFPDLTYRYVSGGDPRKIPDLTYEEWIKFHRDHYHPSNAYFVTYGNIPVTSVLKHVHSGFLSRFQYQTPPPPIPLQKNYTEPVRKSYSFPISLNERTNRKSIAAMLWKLAPIDDFYTNLKLEFLSILLTGDITSLLNQKLLSSNLGGGLAPVGFDNSLRETVFGAGLKDTDEEYVDAIENLILDVLEQIAKEGVPEEEIQAALHQLELSSREIKGDRGIPFGLLLTFRGLPLWLNGGDFLSAMNLDQHLKELKKECRSNQICSELVKTFLLDNPHRVTVVLKPDPGGLERQEKELRRKLDTIKNNLSPEEIKKIIEQTERLEQDQNKEEDTSCMPRIHISDISQEPEHYNQQEKMIDDIPVFKHPNQTNGISYCLLGFKEDSLPDARWMFLPLISELGAAGKSYMEMGRLVRRFTGGIGVKIHPIINFNNNHYQTVITITGKSIPENHQHLLSLMGDLLIEPDTKDVKRLMELINMQKAYALPSVIHQGHRMAIIAAARGLSPLKSVQHRLDGLGFIQHLLKTTPSEIENIPSQLKEILQSTITRQKLSAGLTSRPEDLTSLENAFVNLLNRFPSGAADNSPESKENREHLNEAWLINTEVSFVSKCFLTAGYQHPDSPVLSVLSELMETPLYERIRAKGGAYGAFALYDAEGQIFALTTYRDPHTAESLKAFDVVIDMMGSGEFTDESLEQAIVETIRKKDIPPSPRERGIIAYFHAIKGKTEELRRQYRSGILNTTRDDIIRVVNDYLSQPANANIAVITSPDIFYQDECSTLNLTPISLINN